MLKRNSLYLAWIIALGGTLISLYLSAIQGLPICYLCWYQRICLYPLVIILGLGVYHKESIIAGYCLPLTVIGALIALYQYLIQMNPKMQVIDVCGQGPSCATIHYTLFGFITLPLFSFFCFLLITIFLYLARNQSA